MFQRCDDESLNLRAGLGDGPSDAPFFSQTGYDDWGRPIAVDTQGNVWDMVGGNDVSGGMAWAPISITRPDDPVPVQINRPDDTPVIVARPQLFPDEIMVQAPTVTLNPIFDDFPRQAVREEIAYRAPEPDPVRSAPALAPILSPVAPSRSAPAPAPVFSSQPAPASTFAAPAPAPTAGGGSSGGGMSATILAPRDFAPPGTPAPVATDAGGGDFFGQVVGAAGDEQSPTQKSPVPLALFATLALTLLSR